jgi:pSer/pThr/pTyr-binding forkhead associated (FHA) protein
MEVKLIVANGKLAGTEIPVKSAKFVIGRNQDCQIRPQSPLVSRHHCAIVVDAESVTIEDLGSTNGTIVNGEKLAARHELRNGDHIKVGLLELEVRLPVVVGGKRTPKVHTVQEAAARTAAVSPGRSDDDLDLGSWFGEDDALHEPPATKAAPVGDETSAGASLTDTTTIPIAAALQKSEEERKEEEKKEKEALAKTAAKFNRSTKPKTDSSGAAADDALRHFFHRKKP